MWNQMNELTPLIVCLMGIFTVCFGFYLVGYGLFGIFKGLILQKQEKD